MTDDGKQHLEHLLTILGEKEEKLVKKTLKKTMKQGNQTVNLYASTQEKSFAPTISTGVGLFHLYLRLTHAVTFLNTHDFYNEMIREVREIFHLEGLESWVQESEKVEHYYQQLSKRFLEEGELTLSELLKEELVERLLALKPLDHFYSSDKEQVETDQEVNELIEAVKEDVKKGNRATFKLMQQLETKFEQFVDQVQLGQKEQINQAVQKTKKRNEQLMSLTIEMFDQLDLIYQACVKLGDETISTEVEKVINKALTLLDSNGIEELKVEGQFIDGKTMISLGNVPREQYAPHLEKYQVYSIHQRGFINRDTKELIRKATVITVD